MLQVPLFPLKRTPSTSFSSGEWQRRQAGGRRFLLNRSLEALSSSIIEWFFNTLASEGFLASGHRGND